MFKKPRCCSTGPWKAEPVVLVKGRVAEVNSNACHVTHAHAKWYLCKATAREHGLRLTGQLVPCTGFSMAKGIRAVVPKSTSSRANLPGELVHIQLAGPYQASVGVSEYVIMFTDSASRLIRPHDLKRKPDLPLMVERYIAGLGQLSAFRADDGFAGKAYVKIYGGRGIRCKSPAPATPKHKAPVEISVWRRPRLVTFMEVSRIFFQASSSRRLRISTPPLVVACG